MAFNSEHLGVIAQPIGGNGIRIVSYRTDDAQDVVTSASYFTDATSFGLRESDVIFVSRLFADAGPYIVVIETINAAGDGTAIVSDMERYGIEYQESYSWAKDNYHPLFARAFIKTAGYSKSGDGGAALYILSASEPAHGGKLSITLAFTGITVWYELAEAVVRPEMFGASRLTATDSTAALAAMVTYVNDTSAGIQLSAIYRSTAPLDFTCNSLVINGTTSQTSGFVFQSCHGIRLDQSALSSFSRFSVSKFCLLTNSRSLYDAFTYTGQASTGNGATMRKVHDVHCAGEGYFNLAGAVSGQSLEIRAGGWLNSFNLIDADNSHFDYIRIHGSWQDWQNNDPVNNPKFPTETSGIKAYNSTGIFCNDVQSFYVKHGWNLSGQSEGLTLVDCGSVAVWGGVTANALVGPSNNFKIIRSHFSAYKWGIDIGSDGVGGTMMHVIDGCLIFSYPGNAYSTGFVHIKMGGFRSIIRGNHLHVAAADVAATIVDVGIDLLSSSVLVTGNIFQGLANIVRVGSGAAQNVISLNYTTASETGYALSDAGTGTVCLNNYGDKLWPAAGGNIFIVATGQSNMAREGLLAASGTWVPPRNLRVWNGTPTALGTAWVVPNTSRMNTSWAYGAEVARRNPDANVYVVNISRAGTGILEWTPSFAIIDMVDAIDDNVVAALAALPGETKATEFLFWQGENDAGTPASWPANFELMVTALKAKSWWNDAMHMTVFGITGSANSGDVRHDAMNITIQGVVAKDPSRRSYVPIRTLPAAFWEDTLHLTAEGYIQAGIMAYNVANGGGEGMRMNGGSVTLADDKAVAIAPPFSRGVVEFIGTNVVENASFDFDTVGGVRGRDNGGTEVVFTTGALADAGGTDAKITYSVHTDGLLYISNRRGTSRTIYVSFKGG